MIATHYDGIVTIFSRFQDYLDGERVIARLPIRGTSTNEARMDRLADETLSAHGYRRQNPRWYEDAGVSYTKVALKHY